jgi:hypothetical protein
MGKDAYGYGKSNLVIIKDNDKENCEVYQEFLIENTSIGSYSAISPI